MKKVVKALPRSAQAVLARLAVLLNLVSEHSEKNKMSSENLAICFALTIIKSKDPVVEEQFMQRQISVFEYMMKHFRELVKEAENPSVPLPEDFQKHLQNGMFLLGSQYIAQKENSEQSLGISRRTLSSPVPPISSVFDDVEEKGSPINKEKKNEKEKPATLKKNETRSYTAYPVITKRMSRDLTAMASHSRESTELINLLAQGETDKFLQVLNRSSKYVRDRVRDDLFLSISTSTEDCTPKTLDENTTSSSSSSSTKKDEVINQTTEGSIRLSQGSYQGQMKNNVPHQKGRMEYDNGNLYEGEWRDGVHHGIGTMKYAAGCEYSGQWCNGIREGIGNFKWLNLDCEYQGQWKNDQRHGKGKMTWANGSLYDGDWKDDVRDGFGKIIFEFFFFFSKFRNEFLGRFQFPDGSIYEGEWKDDTREGKGKRVYTNGDIYTGDFVNGNKSGHGVLQRSEWTYEGKFKDGKRHGKGVLVWKDKRRFEGMFKDDKREGYGEMTWPSGNSYKGMWTNDKPSNLQ